MSFSSLHFLYMEKPTNFGNFITFKNIDYLDKILQFGPLMWFFEIQQKNKRIGFAVYVHCVQNTIDQPTNRCMYLNERFLQNFIKLPENLRTPVQTGYRILCQPI